jgi:hypothetical protein
LQVKEKEKERKRKEKRNKKKNVHIYFKVNNIRPSYFKYYWEKTLQYSYTREFL